MNRNSSLTPSKSNDLRSISSSSIGESDKQSQFDPPSASYTRVNEKSIRIDVYLWPTSRMRPGYIRLVVDPNMDESPKTLLASIFKAASEPGYRKSLKLTFRADEENWYGSDLEVHEGQVPLMYFVNERLNCATEPSCGVDYYLLVDPDVALGKSQGTFGKFKIVE